jgi:hypothetical protein
LTTVDRSQGPELAALAEWTWHSFRPGGGGLSPEAQEGEVSKLLAHADQDGDGSITQAEFLAYYETTAVAIEGGETSSEDVTAPAEEAPRHDSQQREQEGSAEPKEAHAEKTAEAAAAPAELPTCHVCAGVLEGRGQDLDGQRIGSELCRQQYKFQQLSPEEQGKRCGNGATGCGEILQKSEDRVEALGVMFHAECFSCHTCGSVFEDDDYLTLTMLSGDRAFDTEACRKQFQDGCGVCHVDRD